MKGAAALLLPVQFAVANRFLLPNNTDPAVRSEVKYTLEQINTIRDGTTVPLFEVLIEGADVTDCIGARR